MSRPRTRNAHLPKYVTVIHGAYWYRPPHAKAQRVGDEGDYTALYRFMSRLGEPTQEGGTLSDLFDRYMERQGRALVLVDAFRRTGLEPVLAKWGVRLGEVEVPLGVEAAARGWVEMSRLDERPAFDKARDFPGPVTVAAAFDAHFVAAPNRHAKAV